MVQSWVGCWLNFSTTYNNYRSTPTDGLILDYENRLDITVDLKGDLSDKSAVLDICGIFNGTLSLVAQRYFIFVYTNQQLDLIE